MGVESNYYIMPASSWIRPAPEAIESLIRSLQNNQYLGEGLNWSVGTTKASGSMVDLRASLDANCSSDIRVRWQIPDFTESGLRYPLTKTPGPDGVYYDIEIHLVGDTAYKSSEIVKPFDSIQHTCGLEIGESPSPDPDVFGAGRLPSTCPACGESLDYAQIPMMLCDPMTGAQEAGCGGITYRCAIVVDCGKYFPDYGTNVDPCFISLIELALGDRLRVMQDFY